MGMEIYEWTVAGWYATCDIQSGKEAVKERDSQPVARIRRLSSSACVSLAARGEASCFSERRALKHTTPGRQLAAFKAAE